MEPAYQAGFFGFGYNIYCKLAKSLALAIALIS
jgi:hypothetical protein